jgi:RNA 2',3'-cyclic 3'-phosphodiesterase
VRRVFVALALPAVLRQALILPQALLPLPARVPPDNFHVTLAYLGAVDDTALEAVDQALAAIRAGPVPLRLTGLGLFGGARPRLAFAAIAPEPRLRSLHDKVRSAVRSAGLVLPAERFVPHVTLGRFAPPAPDAAMRLERAVAEAAAFRAGPAEPAEVTLYESRAVKAGRVYIPLAQYALRGD